MTLISNMFDPEITLPGAIPVTEISQDQKKALDGASTPSETNPYATIDDLPTEDQQDALDNASTPSGTNPLVTIDDLPKWKTYKSLLFQVGEETAPYAKVLNSDARDYLGDVTYAWSATGEYTVTLPYSVQYNIAYIPSYVFSEGGTSYFVSATLTTIDTFTIVVSTFAGVKTDDIFPITGIPFEIYVRERGPEVELLTATIPEDGLSISLIFDQPLNTYLLTTKVLAFSMISTSFAQAVEIELTENPNEIVITLDSAMLSTDITSIAYAGDGEIESTSYGLVASFDVEVTNNSTES